MKQYTTTEKTHILIMKDEEIGELKESVIDAMLFYSQKSRNAKKAIDEIIYSKPNYEEQLTIEEQAKVDVKNEIIEECGNMIEKLNQLYDKLTREEN